MNKRYNINTGQVKIIQISFIINNHLPRTIKFIYIFYQFMGKGFKNYEHVKYKIAMYKICI